MAAKTVSNRQPCLSSLVPPVQAWVGRPLGCIMRTVGEIITEITKAFSATLLPPPLQVCALPLPFFSVLLSLSSSSSSSSSSRTPPPFIDYRCLQRARRRSHSRHHHHWICRGVVHLGIFFPIGVWFYMVLLVGNFCSGSKTNSLNLLNAICFTVRIRREHAFFYCT